MPPRQNLRMLYGWSYGASFRVNERMFFLRREGEIVNSVVRAFEPQRNPGPRGLNEMASRAGGSVSRGIFVEPRAGSRAFAERWSGWQNTKGTQRSGSGSGPRGSFCEEFVASQNCWVRVRQRTGVVQRAA